MADQVSVCHIVNEVGDTSLPGDLAASQTTFDRVERVGILSWFGVQEFNGIDDIAVSSLDVSNDTYRISWRQFQEIKTVLRQYDIVHTHHNHSGFYGKLIAKILGKPVVVTVHNNRDGFTHKGRIADGVTNVVADRVICVSESVRKSFNSWENLVVPDSKISVIHNGVNLDRIENAHEYDWSIHDVVDVDADAVLVGSAGMLVEQKGHDVLIDAVEKANHRSDIPIELVISGDGDRRPELEEQIRTTEYSDRIHLLGYLQHREQVYAMMDEIDVYAMPSRWEGFCVAAIEAMGIGNPCVFSDIPEFRTPFQEIALFHPVDDADTLANHLVTLARDPEKRATLTEKGENEVRTRYSMEITAKKYIDTYCTL